MDHSAATLNSGQRSSEGALASGGCLELIQQLLDERRWEQAKQALGLLESGVRDSDTATALWARALANSGDFPAAARLLRQLFTTSRSDSAALKLITEEDVAQVAHHLLDAATGSGGAGEMDELASLLRACPPELQNATQTRCASLLVDLWEGKLEGARAALGVLADRQITDSRLLHRLACSAAALGEKTPALKAYDTLVRHNLGRADLIIERSDTALAADPRGRTFGVMLPRKKLCIASAVKNEGDTILEWLCFHANLGIEHFYLYLNDCTDNTLADIQRFYNQHMITVHHVPGELGQQRAYNHFIQTYRNQIEWCAFIDIDEYLVPTVAECLQEFVDQDEFREAAAIAVHWLNFGSNHLIDKPDGPTVGAFTARAIDSFPDHHVIKSINRMSAIVSYLHPHQNRMFGMHFQEDGHAALPVSGRLPVPKHFQIRLHHYYTKSEQQMLAKKARGRPLTDDDPRRIRNLEYFRMRDTNDIQDLAAVRFLPSLERALNRCV